MWALVFLVVFVLAISLAFFETVHVGDGYVAVLERFGRFVRILGPGSHVLFRPMHSLRWTHFSVDVEDRSSGNDSQTTATTTTKHTIMHRMIPTRRQVYDPPAWSMQSSDGVTVSVNVVLFYVIVDARSACYATTNYLAAVRESVRQSIKLFVQDTSVHRLHAQLTQSTLHTLLDEEYLESVGIVVEEVRLQNIESQRS
jgi:regulator of protease activity HflC (stomatin/prohibitin superfamily)